MTVLAIVVSLLFAAAAGWWVAQTPGRPSSRSEVPPWAQASSTRALIAVFICAATAGAAGSVAPEAGVWLWVGAIVHALAVIGFTLAGWVTDPTKRVPTMVFPLGWALLALGVGVWVASNTDPVINSDTVDMTRPFAVGQRAAVVVGIVGAVHTWWVWKSRSRQRKSTQARHDAQIHAMRARIDRERAQPTKSMRGRRHR